MPKFTLTRMISRISMTSSRLISLLAGKSGPISPKLKPIAVASVISTISSPSVSPLRRVIEFSIVSGAVMVGAVQLADR